MNLREKYLYHQIHPLKLATDISAGFGSLIPLWQHHLVLALIVMLVPPPIASLLVMGCFRLEWCQQSRLGRYVQRYMTRAMEGMRLLGMVLMAIGAWNHSAGMILVGLICVAFAWLRGKIC